MEHIKKVELHLHLDGSVRVETVEEILGMKNLKKDMIVQDDTQSLTDYLSKFNLPIQAMQTKENLTRISKELVEDLKKDNVIYAEVRFAPNLHTKKGLALDDVVQSVLEGLKDSEIKINLILCMMRGGNMKDNKNIIDLAKKYLNKGVVCVDLAGDEAKYPTSLYQNLFDYAKIKQIPFIIHAGESGSTSDIKNAIDFGASRIGHGIKSIEDEHIIDLLINKNITLEICPTSNVQTHNVDQYSSHPIKMLKMKNVLVTINTDNRTVSNINLNQEYLLLQKYFNFTEKDFEEANINAINASFLSSEEKDKLLYELTKKIS